MPVALDDPPGVDCSAGDARSDANPHAAGTAAGRGDAIGQLTALVHAAQAELGRVVAAADDAGDWRPDGATDMAAWLVGTQAMTTPHAREVVRVAHALEALPALRHGLATGTLSWDQIRPATRFATPDDDHEVADRVAAMSAAQVERLARRLTPRDDADDSDAHRRRRFGWRPDHAAGGFRYTGFLPADAAARVNAALTALARQAGPDPATGVWDPFATRCADALHTLATGQAADTLVVVHVDADVATGAGPGTGDIDDVAVGRAALLRHLCDTGIEHAIHGPDGTCIGIGRRSRSIPPWLRRSVIDRDRRCRFPGCHRPVHHIHHIRHWTAGGPTNAPNLTGTCWHHHHLVHEGGWHITGDANGPLTFHGPLGQHLDGRRPTLRPTIRARAARTVPALPSPDPPPRDQHPP